MNDWRFNNDCTSVASSRSGK